MLRPSASARARTSAGASGELIRSGSKISTPSKPAAAAASSFSSSVPLRQTVAIERRISDRPTAPASDGEVAQHPLAVGRDAGEQLERAGGLHDRHPAAVERPAAELARVLEQLGLERAVDDLGHPQLRAQQLLGEREAGVRGHPGRRGVDQAVGVGELVEVARDRAPSRSASAPRAASSTSTITSSRDAELQRRVRDRRARAAGAEHDDLAQRRVGQPAPEALREPARVGVVPDRAAVVEHDRVDRFQRRGLGREVVEVLDDVLLAGVCHVDAAVPVAAGALEQFAHARVQPLDVEQPVAVFEPLLRRLASWSAGLSEASMPAPMSPTRCIRIMYELVRYISRRRSVNPT